MSTPIPPLTTRLAAHVDALRQADAGTTAQADAAQRRLLATLAKRYVADPPRLGRGRHIVRWATVAATGVAVLIVALVPLVGDRSSSAFAAALQRLREFSTLSMTIETSVAGRELMPPDRVEVDRAGDTRTEISGLTTVIVNRQSGQVLILLQPAHRAIRYSIPRGSAAGPRRNPAWLDAVRSFRGRARELPGTRKFNGIVAHGWEMDVSALHIVLWADAEGVPRAVDVTGAASMHQHMTLTLNTPLPPQLFSTELPPGYALAGPDADHARGNIE
jgi:hypothetical protein